MDRGELVPDDIVIARGRGALRRPAAARARLRARRLPAHAAAGRGARAGRSTDHPLDLVIDLDVPDRDRPRPHRGPAGLRELRRHLPREPAARRSAGPATCAAATSSSATTTPRRPSAAGSRSTTPRPCRSSTSTAKLGKLVVVDGVGNGDEVQSAWSRRSTARFDPERTRDHPQERRADRARCGGPAGSSPRCTRSASAPRKPGATTLDVDAAAREVLERRGARSNFLGYHGFPAVVCTSPNDVIVHGIPSDDVVLDEGDILSIDCGAIIEGWHADAAITVPVGEIDDESKRLIEVTRAVARGRDRRRSSEGNGWATSAPRSRAIAERGRVLGGARVRRPRDRHRHARGPADPELRAGGPGHEAQGRATCSPSSRW